MIELTASAKQHIQESLDEHGDLDGFGLRIVASIDNEDNYHYGIGFDQKKANDIVVTTTVVDILMSPEQEELLKGTKIDYANLQEDKDQEEMKRLIILNPNDPAYTPPDKDYA